MQHALTWTSHVGAWAWAGIPGLAVCDLPALDFIEASQRRRLSPLSKMCLQVMHACAESVQGFHIVYASRHGELDRTTDLLLQMAQGEQVSPTGFSLAVLNATAGLYSIARGVVTPISAVSAGAQTFSMGLLEASLQAQSAGVPVLYVYADAPVPAIYGAAHAVTPDTPVAHALGMVLYPQAQLPGVQLSVRHHWLAQPPSADGANAAATPPSWAFAAWLNAAASVPGAQGPQWSWEPYAAA